MSSSFKYYCNENDWIFLAAVCQPAYTLVLYWISYYLCFGDRVTVWLVQALSATNAHGCLGGCLLLLSYQQPGHHRSHKQDVPLRANSGSRLNAVGGEEALFYKHSMPPNFLFLCPFSRCHTLKFCTEPQLRADATSSWWVSLTTQFHGL